MFPREKYKYFTNNKNLVIAEQTYAGKKYRGKAHLGNGDEFDLSVGKDLAAARCDVLICEKRAKAADDKYETIQRLINFLVDELEWASDYKSDSYYELADAKARLDEIETKLGLK